MQSLVRLLHVDVTPHTTYLSYINPTKQNFLYPALYAGLSRPHLSVKGTLSHVIVLNHVLLHYITQAHQRMVLKWIKEQAVSMTALQM